MPSFKRLASSLLKPLVLTCFTICALLLTEIVSPASAIPKDAQLDFECLQEAYPGMFTGLQEQPDGSTLLILSDGRTLIYDDGRQKSFLEMLNNGDIEDSMRLPYPLEPARPVPGEEHDPGRIHSYALMKVLFGADKTEVKANLVHARLHTKNLMVHKRIAASLDAIQKALPALLKTQPELLPIFKHAIGCQCWRTIAGTNRLSLHSWGTALDIAPDQLTYWRWCKLMPHPLQQTFSPELVALFEANGFIWGGKWRHYDLMHFEYHPELLIKARKLQQRNSLTDSASCALQ